MEPKIGVENMHIKIVGDKSTIKLNIIYDSLGVISHIFLLSVKEQCNY